MGSIHAAAQFALAESASGHYLITHFPELEGQVVPLLRESSMKYTKQAESTVRASASIEDGAVEKFKDTFAKKGRGLLEISVDVMDSNDNITSSGKFRWFLQRIGA